MTEITTGMMWGREYEILEKIGSGGMGVVYKARQKSPERIVALKILIPEKLSSVQLRRFAKEAKLSAMLEHPNIVKVYHLDSYQDTPFIAMVYIDGESFADYLLKSPPLTESLKIVTTIAHALDYAHREGVVHRDLKPANILIDREGIPYLMDFGIARSIKIEDRSLTKTGQILGTPQYMSPEQAQGLRREIDGRSDIYSMGAILYEIATGHPAACGNSPMQILFNVVNKPIISPREINPHMPEPVARIIMKALAYRREKRYQSAGHMARDLENFLAGAAVSARPVRAYHWKCNLLLAVAAIALSIVGWRLWPARPPMDAGPIGFTLAQEAYAAGDYDLAARHLDAILLAEPHHRQALLLRARILERQGRWDEMRIIWAHLTEGNFSAEELQDIGKNAMDTGQLGDARHYLEKSLTIKDTPAGHLLLAETLFQLGKYREAESHYLSADAPEAMLGRAAIYSNERQPERARELLDSIPENSSFTPYLEARRWLVRALIRWGAIQRDLDRWEWLFSQDCHRLENVLKQTAEDLQRAAEALQNGEGYLLGQLHSEVELYRMAVVLESEISDRVTTLFPAYRDKLEKAAIPPMARLFLITVGIRALIRNGLWEDAYRECNYTLEKYPWMVDLCHLRALALFHCSRFSDPTADALQDMYQMRDYQPWNIIPLENCLFLLFESATLQECNDIMEIFIAYHVRLRFTIEQDVLSEYVENMRQEAVGFLPQRSTRVEEWAKLLEVMLDSPSSAARQLARDILSGHYENTELRRKIDEMRSHISQPRRAELDSLTAAIERRKKRDRLEYLKDLLGKLPASIPEGPAMKIRKMGYEGEELLCEIVTGEDVPPMLRLMAARMMVSSGTLPAYRTLTEMARNGRHPANLLAATALVEKGIATSFGVVYSYENPDRAFILAQDPLYQTLWASYLDPARDREALITLLHGKEEMPSLCAAFNLRRCYHLLSPQLRGEVVSCFLQRMASPNPIIRATAVSKFWQFETVGVENDDEREYFDYWVRYGHTLLAILKTEKDPQVLFAAVHGLIASPCFTRYLWKPEFQRLVAIAELPGVLAERVHSPDSDHFSRFWAAAALGSLRHEKIWPILEDSETSFSIRTATVVGIMDNKDDEGMESLMSTLHKFIKFMEQKAKEPAVSLNDRILKQTTTLIITMPHINLLSRTPVKEILRSSLNDRYPSVRSMALSMLGFHGEAEDIDRVYPYLNHSDINIQRAAAGSLALLLMSYQVNELPQYKEELERLPKPVLKAAAYGYYSAIKRENLFRPRARVLSLKFPKFAKNYDMEIARLLEERTERWVPVLEHACELWPTTRYFYESALLAHKFQHYADAHARIDRALSALDREPAHRQKDFEKRCHLLRAEIFIEEHRPREAVACLEGIVKKYPLEWDLHFHLSMHYLDLGERDQYREQLWLSYLCDPNGLCDYLTSKPFAKSTTKNRADDIVATLKQKFAPLTKFDNR